MNLRRGLRKQDVDDLETVIPRKDTIADRDPHRPLYYGSHEQIENALVPWLRRRRRARPR